VRGIALKIFVSFWLIFAVLIAVFALLPSPVEGFRFRDHLQGFGVVGAEIFSKHGGEVCADYSAAVAASAGIRFALLDSTGAVVCQAPDANVAGRTAQREAVAIDGAGLPNARLTATGEALPTFDAVRPAPPFPYRGVVLAIVISGIVCFSMARYLARPLQLVRDASNRLAAGDLHARAGPSGGRRRDEIGDLVRDFDAMAARLQAFVDIQQQLLTDISHELRSPIARLNVALELARRKVGGAATTELGRIEMEANRMNELIGRVLTLARAESGLQRSNAVELNAVAAQVVADANYEAQRNEKSVALVQHSAVTIQGDVHLIASAIDNVVRNAVRHTLTNSSVVVSVARTPHDAVVMVSDRGPGVPESELEKIFMPFHRVDSGRDRETGGVGLGLGIARRAVALHGGTITARNREDGGLAVSIHLPLAPRTPAAAHSA
jgi:two-component system sensor histidine kinase CpxA